MVSPGSQRQRFFLASHQSEESMIWDSTALMTKMGGFFLLISMRPTSTVSNGTLTRTNLLFGVAARHASLPLSKMISRLWLLLGSVLNAEECFGLTKPI